MYHLVCLYVVFLPPGGQISLSFKYKYRFIESYVSQKPQDVVLECVASSTTQIYLVYCYREGKKIKFLLSFNKIKIKKKDMKDVHSIIYLSSTSTTTGSDERKLTLPPVCCGRPCSPSTPPPPQSAGTSLKEAAGCWPSSGRQPSHPGPSLRRRGGTDISSSPRPSGPKGNRRSSLPESRETTIIEPTSPSYVAYH